MRAARSFAWVAHAPRVSVLAPPPKPLWERRFLHRAHSLKFAKARAPPPAREGACATRICRRLGACACATRTILLDTLHIRGMGVQMRNSRRTVRRPVQIATQSRVLAAQDASGRPAPPATPDNTPGGGLTSQAEWDKRFPRQAAAQPVQAQPGATAPADKPQQAPSPAAPQTAATPAQPMNAQRSQAGAISQPPFRGSTPREIRDFNEGLDPDAAAASRAASASIEAARGTGQEVQTPYGKVSSTIAGAPSPSQAPLQTPPPNTPPVNPAPGNSIIPRMPDQWAESSKSSEAANTADNEDDDNPLRKLKLPDSSASGPDLDQPGYRQDYDSIA